MEPSPSKKVAAFNVFLGQFKTDMHKVGQTVEHEYVETNEQLEAFVNKIDETKLLEHHPEAFTNYEPFKSLVVPEHATDAKTFWEYMYLFYETALSKKKRNHFKQLVEERQETETSNNNKVFQFCEDALIPVGAKMCKALTEKDIARVKRSYDELQIGECIKSYDTVDYLRTFQLVMENPTIQKKLQQFFPQLKK
jgi:hypothetical protein